MTQGTMAFILAAACALSACGGPQVMLKNPQNGEVASCKGGTTAAGMTSERVAEDLLTRCVDGYTQQGYEVVSATR